jgi:hypothetical protein
MRNTRPERQSAATPKSLLLRQLIFGGVALGIMGAGVWSLLGQQAPYHPQMSPEEVSRAGAVKLYVVGD